MEWTCASCAYENDAGTAACDSCGEAAPAAAPAPPADAPLVVCGLVTALAAVPGKDKLRAVTVDVGAAAAVELVTSAPNVAVGARVVVALPGAMVPVDGEDVVVKAATVGGVKSSGMLCDAPMLRWVGGGAGLAALLPESFAVGAPPPATKPRLK
jgi:tRNA-binding EMAP/Myf-like protein